MAGALPDYPFYSALWNGFYNKRFYASAATRWQGRGIAYLLLAVALGLVPLIFVLGVMLERFYTGELPHILRQLPEIMFSDGKASVQGEQPLVIRTSGGEALIMIDTQGSYHTPDEAGVSILLTDDALIVRQSSAETRSYSFHDMKQSLLLTPRMVEELAIGVKPWILPVSFMGMWLVFVIGRLLQSLFYAVVGMAIAAMLRVDMQFSALWQVSLITVGNVVLVTAVLGLLMAHVPMLLTVPLALFYLWFGIKATRDWAREMQAQA